MSPTRAKVDALHVAWRHHFGAVPPLGHQLRHALPQRWLRVHHLPQARRHPETPGDWTEALARHNAVAAWLLGEAHAVWRIEVCTVQQAGERGWVRPMLHTEEWAEALRARQTRWLPHAHDEAIAAVLAERAGPMLWADLARGCVYAPYAGGADLICVDGAQRAHGLARFADWLSPHPSGL
ncbi:DUF3885 domain-containing protein [Comamonas serinivorans]|nr:hypothetical protein [Comamonas serinivorans]